MTEYFFNHNNHRKTWVESWKIFKPIMRKCDRARNRTWDLPIITKTLCHLTSIPVFCDNYGWRNILSNLSLNSVEFSMVWGISFSHLSSLLYVEWDKRPTRECAWLLIVLREVRWQSVSLRMGRFEVRFLARSHFRIIGLNFFCLLLQFSYDNYCWRNIQSKFPV